MKIFAPNDDRIKEIAESHYKGITEVYVRHIEEAINQALAEQREAFADWLDEPKFISPHGRKLLTDLSKQLGEEK